MSAESTGNIVLEEMREVLREEIRDIRFKGFSGVIEEVCPGRPRQKKIR